jgi:hypothetical protein
MFLEYRHYVSPQRKCSIIRVAVLSYALSPYAHPVLLQQQSRTVVVRQVSYGFSTTVVCWDIISIGIINSISHD